MSENVNIHLATGNSLIYDVLMLVTLKLHSDYRPASARQLADNVSLTVNVAG